MAITIKNLNFSFENKEPLFNDFSYVFAQPGIYCVQGKNGAGKSTLFSLITGKKPFKSKVTGLIEFNDHEYSIGSLEHQTYAQKFIRTVPQRFDDLLVPQFTFIENLQAAHFSSRPVFEKLPHVDRLLSLYSCFNIPLNQPIERCSGGQRQISAIAMSMHVNTQLLLLDEPTAAFDEKNTQLVMEFLVKLQQETGITIFMICHDSDLFSYSPYKPLIIGKV